MCRPFRGFSTVLTMQPVARATGKGYSGPVSNKAKMRVRPRMAVPNRTVLASRVASAPGLFRSAGVRGWRPSSTPIHLFVGLVFRRQRRSDLQDDRLRAPFHVFARRRIVVPCLHQVDQSRVAEILRLAEIRRFIAAKIEHRIEPDPPLLPVDWLLLSQLTHQPATVGFKHLFHRIIGVPAAPCGVVVLRVPEITHRIVLEIAVRVLANHL